MFKRSWAKVLTVAVSAAMVAGLAGCAGSGGSGDATSAPGEGNILTISAGGDPLAIDPSLIKSGLGTQISLLMAETLTTFFYNNKLEGLLATSWKPNATADVWTFKLRKDVKFADGTPFNALAVQKSVNRLLDPTLAVVTSNDVGKFTKSVDVVDDLTVAFTLKQPVSYFPEALSNQTTAITSPASWTVAPNTYKQASNVVGTGPYKLDKWTQNESITLSRNDSYWGKKPYYKSQVFKFIPDPNARETSLKAGEIDVATGLPAADIQSMKADDSLKVQVGFGTRINYMAFNTTSTVNPLLQNPKVRQALNYAVDKEAIIKNVLFGAGELSTSPVVNGAFGQCKTGPYKYDPKKAKELLKEAGASDMSITIVTPNGRFLQDSQTAQAVAGYLTAAGVKVNGPLIQDNAANQAIITAPPAKSNVDPLDQLFLWSFGADFPHSSQSLGSLYSSTSIPPASGLNFSHYANPKVDSLTLEAARDADQKSAAAKYCEAQKLVWDAAPAIFLWTAGFLYVSSSKVAGLSTGPNSVVNTVYAYPVKK